MRKWLAPLLLLAMAILPSAAQAQYPPGYYYSQPYGYRSPYPYYIPASHAPQPAYYTPPMPRYTPIYPAVYPGISASQPPAWQGAPIPNEMIVTVPHPAPTSAKPAAKPSSGLVVDTEKPEPPANKLPSANDLPAAPTDAPPAASGKTPPPAKDSAPVPMPAERPGHACRVSIFGDLLYWNVHGVDVPYAQSFDGVGILSVPRGPVGVVSPQLQMGFRVGGGASFDDGETWVTGAFTYFTTRRTSTLAAGDGQVLHDFLAYPNTINAAPIFQNAASDYRIRLYMGDLNLKGVVAKRENCNLNWFAGVRYAHLEQNLFTTFQVLGETTIDSKINFDGIGPRLGLDGEIRFKHGFFGYGQGVIDVLFGQFRGSYEQRNVFIGQVGQTTITANRVVPILELELGGGWQSANGRYRLAGGYYIGSWYNTMTTPSFAGAISNANFTTNGNNFRDNMVFDGFVARFEFRY